MSQYVAIYLVDVSDVYVLITNLDTCFSCFSLAQANVTHFITRSLI